MFSQTARYGSYMLQNGLIGLQYFQNSDQITKNEGVITGVPIYSYMGATFDGSQCIDYPVTGALNQKGLTFHIRFIPTFDHTDGTTRYIFRAQTTGGNYVTSMYLEEFGGVPTVKCYIYDTAVTNSSDITSILLRNQWNTLTFSVNLTSNEVLIILNNTTILDSTIAVTTRRDVDILRVGQNIGGGNAFEGVINKYYIYNKYFNINDIKRLNNNKLGTIKEKAAYCYPMSSYTHDITNKRTLDVSRNKRHATLGDGATAAFFPTRLYNKRGYNFDGNDWLALTSNITAPRTIAVMFRSDPSGVTRQIIRTGLGQLDLHLYSDRKYHITVAGTDKDTSLEDLTGLNYTIMVVVTDGECWRLYYNGRIVYTFTSATVPSAITSCFIGSSAAGAKCWNSHIYCAALWEEALSQFEVTNITKWMWQKARSL